MSEVNKAPKEAAEAKLARIRAEFKKSTLKQKKKIFLTVHEENLGNVTQTCKFLVMERQTYYNWCKADPKFDAKSKEIGEVVVDFAESSLMRNIREGKETSVIFFLKTKGKHRGYIETNHNMNTNVERDDLDSKTDEELWAIINRKP